MFKNMEYVYAVYKAGSFSQAAEELFISQPCLSAMIKKVEKNLGVPIFDRKSKPLCLTEYGEKYISYIEKQQQLERELEQYLNDVRGLKEGKLSLGANHVFASYILPNLIHNFKSRYPKIDVHIVEGNIYFFEDALLNGTVDLFVDNCKMDSSLYSQHVIGTEQMLLAVHKSLPVNSLLKGHCLSHNDILSGIHKKNTIPFVSAKAFANTSFITLRTGNDTRARLEDIFNKTGATLNVQLEVDQLATAYNISCNGLGATCVSDTLLYNTPLQKDMCYYRLPNDVATRPIYLYHKRSRYVTLAMQKFIDTALLDKKN